MLLRNADLEIQVVSQKELTLVGTYCYTPSSGLGALPLSSHLIPKGKTMKEVLALDSHFTDEESTSRKGRGTCLK